MIPVSYTHLEGKNVEEVRFTSGMKMGQKDESEVDCACGIPDSGVGMALGYAEGKGVPYHRAISKYTPTWPRSFTPVSYTHLKKDKTICRRLQNLFQIV